MTTGWNRENKHGTLATLDRRKRQLVADTSGFRICDYHKKTQHECIFRRRGVTVPSRKPSRSTALLAEISKFAGAHPDRTGERLLETLRKHFRGVQIHLFETKGRRVVPVEADTDLEKFVDMADVNSCLSDRKPVTSRSSAKPTTLIPVLVNGTAVMIVLARSTPRSNSDIDELAALIRAYGDVLSLVQVSERDTLTGLYNRRMLDRRLHELMSTLGSPRRRTLDPVSAHVALIDLDRFKKINDAYGHLYGDEVLLLFGGLMKQSFRATDLLVRYGGEEFVVVLTDATLDNCEIVLERFRSKVEEYWFPHVGHVTISTGAARIGNQALASTVLDQADQALYYAKHSGRNRVCHYEALVRDGLMEVQESTFGDGQPFEEKRKLETRRKAGMSRRAAPGRGKNGRRSRD